LSEVSSDLNVNESLTYRLKHATGIAEELQIARLRVTCDLVEPSDGLGLKAGFGRTVGGINELDLHFNGVLTALHPLLSRFASFVHLNP